MLTIESLQNETRRTLPPIYFFLHIFFAAYQSRQQRAIQQN